MLFGMGVCVLRLAEQRWRIGPTAPGECYPKPPSEADLPFQ